MTGAEAKNIGNKTNKKANKKEWKGATIYPAHARSALRALGLLLADGTPTVGGGKTF